MTEDTTTVPESTPVELRGVRFALTDSGEGPVVLDAHGLSASRANARAMGLDFAEVASRGHRLVSYDARGHGRSSGTKDPDDYTWASLATDLLALADHFSPDAPVGAIGSSMGTGTILHAALRRPDRFDRLVLTAPPTAWDTRAPQAGVYRQMADFVEANGAGALAGMMGQAPIPPVFQGLASFPPLPDIAEALLPTVFRGAGRADLPPLEALAAITQPTLILAWTDDPGHPLISAERLVATLPNAVLEIAATHEEFLTWGHRAAEFVTAS